MYAGYKCNLEKYSSTPSQLVCYTPAFAREQTFTVSVRVTRPSGAVQQDSACCFSARQRSTPRLIAVEPQGITANFVSNLTLVGDEVFGRAARFGGILSITVGSSGVLCDQSFYGESDDDGEIAGVRSYDTGVTYMECTLREPLDPSGIASSGNVSVLTRLEREYIDGYAMADTSTSLARRATDGVVYHVQQHPIIYSLTPTTGSIVGGNIIKLQGDGFPQSLDAATLSGTHIAVDGSVCQLISASRSEIECETLPPAANKNVSAISTDSGSIRGGGRGVSYHVFWNTSDTSIPGTRTPDKSDQLTGPMEVPRTLEPSDLSAVNDAWVSQMQTVFVAQDAGNYTPYITGDGLSEVRIISQSGSIVEYTAGSSAGNAHPRAWNDNAKAVEGPMIELGAQEEALLDIVQAHSADALSSHGAFAIMMPGTGAPRFDNPEEHQEIALCVDRSGQRQILKLASRTKFGQGQLVNLTLPSENAQPVNMTIGLQLGNQSSLLFLHDATDTTTVSEPLQTGIATVLEQHSTADGLSVQHQRSFPSELVNFTEHEFLIDMPLDAGKLEKLQLNFSRNDGDTPVPEPTQASIAREYIDPSNRYELSGSLILYTGSYTSSSKSIEVPFNASSYEFEAACQELTGKNVNVRNRKLTVDEVLGTSGFEWTVEVLYEDGAAQPLDALTARTYGTEVSFKNTVIPPTEKLGGSLSVALRNHNVSVPTDANATELERMLEGEGSFADARVFRHDTGQWRWATQRCHIWTIYAPTVTNGAGAIPLPNITVASGAQLTGTNVQNFVTVYQKATVDKVFSGPLAAEQLRVPVAASAEPVAVHVNGISASFNESCGCRYKSSLSETPELYAVDPSNGTLSRGSNITITGAKFAGLSTPTVQVGGATSIVSSYNDTQINCTISGTAGAGSHAVQVMVPGRGDAQRVGTINETSVSLAMELDSIEPRNLVSHGFTLLNLFGAGFSTSCDSMSVHVSGSSCAMVECTSEKLSCWLIGTGLDTGTRALDIEVSEATFGYNASQTFEVLITEPFANITSTSSPVVSSAGGELVFHGSGLTNATFELFPASRRDVGDAITSLSMRQPLEEYDAPPYEGIAEDDIVTCSTNTTASNSSTRVCSVAHMRATEYFVKLSEPTGEASYVANTSVLAQLDVMGIQPHNGSVKGGTYLTIEGVGFAHELPEQNAVFVRVPVSTAYPNGIVQCDVQAANYTHIECSTRPHCSIQAGPDDPFADRCALVETQPGEVDVKVCPKQVRDALGFVIDGLSDGGKERCWADSTIPLATSGMEKFAYQFGQTPAVIDATVSYSNQTANIQAVVQNMPSDPILLLGEDEECMEQTTDFNKSTISCGVDTKSTPAGTYSLRVDGRSSGDLGLTSMPVELSPILESLSDSQASLTGGIMLDVHVNTELGMTLNSSHPEANVVTLGKWQHPCDVVNISSNKLTCRPVNINKRARVDILPMPEDRSFVTDFQSIEPSDKTYTSRLSGISLSDFGLTDSNVALRISGYLYLTDGTYTFSAKSAGGNTIMLVNGVRIEDSRENQDAEPSIKLSTGFKFFEVFLFDNDGSDAFLKSVSVRGDMLNETIITASNITAEEPDEAISVQLFSNDILARTAATAPKFTYSLDGVRSVEGLSSTKLTWMDGSMAVNMTLTADSPEASEADITASIGGDNIDIVKLSPRVYELTLPREPAYTYEPTIFVVGDGRIDDVPNLTYEAQLSSISPSDGSKHGGTPVTIVGTGFAATDVEDGFANHIMVGNGACTDVISNGTHINCTIPFAEHEFASVDVSVAVLAEDDSKVVISKADAFTFSDNHTPCLNIPSGNLVLLDPYATGQLLNFTAQVPASESSVNVKRAWVADMECSNITKHDSFFTCQAPALPNGNFTLTADVDGFGIGRLEDAVGVPLRLDTQELMLNGSAAGGRVVQFSGDGFHEGNTAATNVTVAGRSCDVFDGNSTFIRCVVQPSLDEDGNPAYVSGDILVVSTNASADVHPLKAGTFAFEQSLTPEVSGVHPRRGSTEGGTRITITGSRLPSDDASTVAVHIGETQCTNLELSASGSEMKCTTSKPNTTETRRHEALEVTVRTNYGRSISTSEATFQYADAWSASTTWGGGKPPAEGDSVLIPANMTVFLDESPPVLNLMIVEGILEFDDSIPQLELHAHYILLQNGGRIRIGSEEKPYNADAQATIVMHGSPQSPELPVYGAKTLAVRDGVLDLHGHPRNVTWTKLAQDAEVGNSFIIVDGWADWVAGDKIVLASSSFFFDEYDTATIASASHNLTSGNTHLTLNSTLRYTHLGQAAMYGSKTIDMRSEVGLLSRNVRVMGDANSDNDAFGAQVMIHGHTSGHCPPKKAPDNCPPSQSFLRLDNVEVSQAGQAFRLGRYAIHFHMQGEASGSYVRNSAVYNSNNRAITIHGTHKLRVHNNVVHNIKGHSVFLEDGIEQLNNITSNLVVGTKKSTSLLNTDTTPASYWITNPNNRIEGTLPASRRHQPCQVQGYRECFIFMVAGNAAAGSAMYGYWFDLEDHPTGPSATTEFCPNRQPLGSFENNSAHSNFRYSLRIWPEMFPSEGRCNGQVPVSAHFKNFTAYKSGQKGAIVTEFEHVLFDDFRLADNGGGPPASEAIVNGKEHPGSIEFTWLNFNRFARVPHSDIQSKMHLMPGLVNSVIVARTDEGMQSTAGWWNYGRGNRGLITQSRNSLLQVSNVTFVGYEEDSEFVALEACGKCKFRQGGVTTHFANITWYNPHGGMVKIADWSYSHQGVFLDADGSLVGATMCMQKPGNFCIDGITYPGPSIVAENGLLLDEECIHPSSVIVGGGRICKPGVVFRRFMLNNHRPRSLKFMPLRIRMQHPEDSTRLLEDAVEFSKYNDMGYQAALVAHRNYSLSWENDEINLSPERFTLHDIEKLEKEDYWLFNTWYPRKYEYFSVDWSQSNLNSTPTSDAPYGAFYYNNNYTVNPFEQANETRHTLLVAGDGNDDLTIRRHVCPPGGCDDGEVPLGEELSGFWSEIWEGRRDGGKPKAGEDAVISRNWDVILDEDTPLLRKIEVYGNLTLLRPPKGTSLKRRINAMYIVVNGGTFAIGSNDEPFTGDVEINLHGKRDSESLYIGETRVGSKVVAAINGGEISLHGRTQNKRWLPGVSVSDDGTELMLPEPVSWCVDDELLVTSASWNPREHERRRITALASNGTRVTLDRAFERPHSGKDISSKFGATMSLAAEAGHFGSNIQIKAADADVQDFGRSNTTLAKQCRQESSGSTTDCSFGCRVVASGFNSSLQLHNVRIERGGQAGLLPAVSIEGVDSQQSPRSTSLLNNVFDRNLDGGISVLQSNGVLLHNNFVLESFDAHGIAVTGTGNLVKGNLMVDSVKVLDSKFDTFHPASFMLSGDVEARENVAAGADRFGFQLNGDVCGTKNPRFTQNKAHACVIGINLVGSESSCTLLSDFFLHHNWDFGLLAGMQGIQTDVEVERVILSDIKHAGLQIQRKGGFVEHARASLKDALFVGRSSANECNKCMSGSEDGCHPNKAPTSEHSAGLVNGAPSYGLVSSSFALSYVPGPPKYPWHGVHDDPMVHGIMNINRVQLVGFGGASQDICGENMSSYAFSSYWQNPDAFKPHFFADIDVDNGVPFDGIVKLHDANPAWRNPSDCGTAEYIAGEHVLRKRNETDAEVGADGRIALNCQGPRHATLVDYDGSLLGRGDGGTLTGYHPTRYQRPRLLQGTPVSHDVCEQVFEHDAYFCKHNVNVQSFPKIKGRPIAGQLADLQLLVLESRDDDKQTRDFSPVLLEDSVTKHGDLLVAAQDKGWCHGSVRCLWELLLVLSYARIQLTDCMVCLKMQVHMPEEIVGFLGICGNRPKLCR